MDCPKCGSVKTKLSSMTTEVAYSPFTDDQGKEHHHDYNRRTSCQYCKECGHDWNHKIVPDTCWCGWNQHIANSGYQGKAIKN